MVRAGDKTQFDCSPLNSFYSLFSCDFEDHISLLINSAGVLSTINSIKGLIVCSVDSWDLSPLGIFGDFECRAEYFVSCEGVRKSIAGRNAVLWDCSGCKLCSDVESVFLLPIFFENRVYAMFGFFGDFNSEDLRFLECVGKALGSLVYIIDVKKELFLAKEIVVENLSQFEYIVDKLRNPLTAIVGYLEIREDIGYEKAFEGIKLQTERMKRVLDVLKKREKITYDLKKKFEEIF